MHTHLSNFACRGPMSTPMPQQARVTRATRDTHAPAGPMHRPWPGVSALQLSPGLSSSSWKVVRSQSSARPLHVSPASTRVVGWQPDRSEPSVLSPASQRDVS